MGAGPGASSPAEISIRDPRSATGDPSLPGLYIHVPFCRTKCPYCAFSSQTDLSRVPEFPSALWREMETAGPEFKALDTVYIGGGTPSILSPRQIEEIFAGICRSFSLAPGAEVTLEANPGDLDLSLLRFYRRMGMNRLNLGVQSFDPGALDFLGRRHTVEQAVRAIDDSRRAGFDNLGLDLIYAVPGQSLKGWLGSLARLRDFAPEHLSCYQLTPEEGTPLYRAFGRGDFTAPGDDELLQFFMATSRFLEAEGYLHYEVSNYARGGRNLSRHNQKYWDHTPYLGLGPSAHSFSGSSRWWNFRSVEAYLSALRAGAPPVEGRESLSPDQLRDEAFLLGIRTRKGIEIDRFNRQHRCDLLGARGQTLCLLQKEGLITLGQGFLRPTRAGLAVADRMALL